MFKSEHSQTYKSSLNIYSAINEAHLPIYIELIRATDLLNQQAHFMLAPTPILKNAHAQTLTSLCLSGARSLVA